MRSITDTAGTGATPPEKAEKMPVNADDACIFTSADGAHDSPCRRIDGHHHALNEAVLGNIDRLAAHYVGSDEAGVYPRNVKPPMLGAEGVRKAAHGVLCRAVHAFAHDGAKPARAAYIYDSGGCRFLSRRGSRVRTAVT